MIQGIDVSKWNGTIDWDLVAAAGIKFVMIRIGTGGSKGGFNKDPLFETNVYGAYRVGIPIGVYMYSYARTPEAAGLEADKTLAALEPFRSKISYPVVYDIEEKAQALLGRDICTEMCNAFCDRVRNAGYVPMIYANQGWLINYLNADQLRADIWLALWKSSDTYTGSHIMWQYTASGSVPGIEGDVDLNKSYFDYAVKADEPVSDWAKSSLEWAKKNGIIFGDENGYYGLKEPCSVERLMVFLHRLYKLMNEDDGK